MEYLSQLLNSRVIGAYVNAHEWMWPLCEVAHYVGMSLIIGIVGLLDLRILGYARAVPPAAINRLVPLAVFGFALNVISGYIFLAGNAAGGAEAYLTNLSFQLKMLLLLLAGLNVLFFYVTGLERKVVATPAGGDAPTAAKVFAAFSLVFWIFIIFFGRMLMYNDVLLLLLGI